MVEASTDGETQAKVVAGAREPKRVEIGETSAGGEKESKEEVAVAKRAEMGGLATTADVECGIKVVQPHEAARHLRHRSDATSIAHLEAAARAVPASSCTIRHSPMLVSFPAMT